MRAFILIVLVAFYLVCHQAMAQSVCEDALFACSNFADDQCVKQYCQYDCDPKCCGLSTFADQQNCLEGGTNTPTTTNSNYVACGTAQAIISACQTIIPTFTAASIPELEECFCYDKRSTFDPDPFVDGIEGCVSYFSTANPSLVPLASSYLGFCTVYQEALSSAIASAAASTAPPSAAASTSLHRSSPPESAISSTTSEPHPRGSQTSSASSSPTATPTSGSRLSMSLGKAVGGTLLSFGILLFIWL